MKIVKFGGTVIKKNKKEIVCVNQLIERFDIFATQLISRSPPSVDIVIKILTKIVYHVLPRLKCTVLQMETLSFYESLLWNARRVLHEPDAVSSIKANQNGMARLRAPRSVRTEAELRQLI